MEIHRLAYFVAVAEESNFTRAAARLHVAQPGVSAQIQKLERELGEPLFDRTGRAVRLTDVGIAVLPYARAVLGAVEGARHAVAELTGLLRGRVAVGMVANCSVLGVPDLLADFHADHAAIEISLTEDTAERLCADLRGGALDVAVIGLTSAEPPGLALHVVVDEPLVAVVAPDHPLAARTTIPLADLVTHPLISLTRGTGLRACLDEACEAEGLRPRIAFQAADPQVLVRLAERGLGAALVPASLARQRRDTLHAITILRPAITGRLALAWPSDRPLSPAARALINRLVKDLPAPQATAPARSAART